MGEDDLAKLAQEVEELIRARGLAEINAHEVGLTILEPLSAGRGRLPAFHERVPGV